jgi:hypothetical protein
MWDILQQQLAGMPGMCTTLRVQVVLTHCNTAGIGFCSEDVNLTRLPSCEAHSYGYQHILLLSNVSQTFTFRCEPRQAARLGGSQLWLSTHCAPAAMIVL